MTLQEYLGTPETVVPQELIYWAVRVADSPTPAHQEAVAAVFLALHEHVSARNPAEAGANPAEAGSHVRSYRPTASASRSHALALSQSRCTVRSDMLRASAVSASDRPPK
jgi:hypothetical protein